MSYFNKERHHTPKSKKNLNATHLCHLFVFGVIATIATYIVPSGEFKRIKGPEGREMVDADSFHYITSAPVGIVDFISIIPRGLIEAGKSYSLH